MSKLKFLSRFTPGTFSDEKIHPLIDEALDDGNHHVREAVASNPSATKDHLDKALTDHVYRVRRSVASNPSATKEHLDKALTDKSLYVREAAARNPRYKEYYPNGHK